MPGHLPIVHWPGTPDLPLSFATAFGANRRHRCKPKSRTAVSQNERETSNCQHRHSYRRLGFHRTTSPPGRIFVGGLSRAFRAYSAQPVIKEQAIVNDGTLATRVFAHVSTPVRISHCLASFPLSTSCRADTNTAAPYPDLNTSSIKAKLCGQKRTGTSPNRLR